MKLIRLQMHKTRTTADQAAVQSNGRIRISPTLSEKIDFKEGDKVDVFIDQDDKSFIYVCKGEMYSVFRHVKGSGSSIYFGSATMFKELGVENLERHALTAALFNINKKLYLRLDISEILPKVLKPLTQEVKEAINSETKQEEVEQIEL